MQKHMKCYLDTTGITFTVTMEPDIKKGLGGKQRLEKDTGRPMWTTQVMALDPVHGASIIDITTAGEKPQLTVGQPVHPVRLEAIPYLQGGREGRDGRDGKPEPITLQFAYRATNINVIDPVAVGKKSASAS